MVEDRDKEVEIEVGGGVGKEVVTDKDLSLSSSGRRLAFQARMEAGCPSRRFRRGRSR